jgi:hypothetical protein
MQRSDLENETVQRIPLTGHVGKSGASLERWVLRDGSRVVVKRLTPATDLVMSLTLDRVGREYALWASGLLDRLPEGVGHAVLGGWPEPDGAVLVMRDLDGRVLSWDDRLTAEQCTWAMRRLAAMHDSFHGVPLGSWQQALTPLAAQVSLFSPDRLRPHLDDDNPLPRLATRGWELFAQMVEPGVADPVLELLRHPAPLVNALRRCPCTLTHGDLAIVNMAVESDVLVLLDWSMPASAPGAMDVARFVAGCASRVELTREEVIGAYAEAAGPGFSEPAMRLALLAATVWLGWNKALDALEHPDVETREREREDLEWWVGQARTTLRTGLL